MRLGTWWFITSRRAHNRWLDLRGRLSGFCMADTWREDTEHGPSFAPGYAHWRCWRKRHPAHELHRTNNYVWPSGGPPRYDPLPVRNADNSGWFDGRGVGNEPRWGRHHLVASRGRARRAARFAEQTRQARRAARSRGEVR